MTRCTYCCPLEHKLCLTILQFITTFLETLLNCKANSTVTTGLLVQNSVQNFKSLSNAQLLEALDSYQINFSSSSSSSSSLVVYTSGIVSTTGYVVSLRKIHCTCLIIIIVKTFYSLWSIRHPRRASRCCDLQLSP
jgi:hypothetical protein